MALVIDQLIEPAQCQKWVDVLDNAAFESGAASAGWYARDVKNNEQLVDKALQKQIETSVRQAMAQSAAVTAYARPLRMGPVLVSRYQEGGSYGPHVDNAIMQVEGQPVRSDFSVTLFLSSPDSYQGGELIIESPEGKQTVKLAAGAAVVYPCGASHQVMPVTSGQRMVVVGWMQSAVRRADQRELLADLERARANLFQTHGRTDETDLLSKVFSNLLRQWGEF